METVLLVGVRLKTDPPDQTSLEELKRLTHTAGGGVGRKTRWGAPAGGGAGDGRKEPCIDSISWVTGRGRRNTAKRAGA